MPEPSINTPAHARLLATLQAGRLAGVGWTNTHIVALNLSAEKCLKFSSLFSAGPAPQFRPRSVEYERGSGKMRKSSRIAPASVGILAVSPAEAGRLAGIGRTTIYHAISSGDLKSLKIGARRLVAVEALREWLLKHEVRQ